MEHNEINDPLSACYREIEEESGITKSNISTIELLYIVTRRSKDEIRQSYIYFGETLQIDIIQTNEGELFWVSKNELLKREYTIGCYIRIPRDYTCDGWKIDYKTGETKIIRYPEEQNLC